MAFGVMTFGAMTFGAMAFGVWRSAFGVRRSAFGVWRLASGVRRSAFGRHSGRQIRHRESHQIAIQRLISYIADRAEIQLGFVRPLSPHAKRETPNAYRPVMKEYILKDQKIDNRPPRTFVANDPGLDFLNSIGTPADTVVERIANGEDLLAWLVEAKLLDAVQAAATGANSFPGELDEVQPKRAPCANGFVVSFSRIWVVP
jgi:putative stress-induced transcription regulator